MAKKDTYLALLRRGIDETTANQLAEAGLKIGDLKRITKEQLVGNYGVKGSIAESVIEIIQSGAIAGSRQRFLTNVLTPSKPMDKIEEARFKREQKDINQSLVDERERLKEAKVEQYRGQKTIMNRLGKTVELIVKLEDNFDDESKDDQRMKIRDQLETRGLEAARDHEMLELLGTPQDIVDFRRKLAPTLCLHACPDCGENDSHQRALLNLDDPDDWKFSCYECGHGWSPSLVSNVDDKLEGGHTIVIDEDKLPRSPVPSKPLDVIDTNVTDMILADLEKTGADADKLAEVVATSNATGGLMQINDWIDQTIAAKGYIQSQEDREDFILRTGAGATKFNKWMKKAELYFNKQTGRWTRYNDNN